jgi:hypothetical protein
MSWEGRGKEGGDRVGYGLGRLSKGGFGLSPKMKWA